MRPLLTRLPAIALLFVSGLLHAAPPSQAQVDQLLEITRVRENPSPTCCHKSRHPSSK